MSLVRRVSALETRMLPREPPELEISEENRAIMQGIIDRAYADPVRYADRIELFRKCEARQRGGSSNGRVMAAGLSQGAG